MAWPPPLNPEDERSVIEIMRQDLIKGFGDAVEFKKFEVVPSEDIDGEIFHHIMVYYSGDGELLDSGWLVGIIRRNRERLEKHGLSLIADSYIDIDELREMYEECGKSLEDHWK